MPDISTTSQVVFAELNAISERHPDADPRVILAAIMAWSASQCADRSDLDDIGYLAEAICDGVTRIGVVH